jgi:hypothetical protein
MIRELQSLTGTNKRWKGVSHRLAAHTSPRGQSLVEMALIAPVLILMFIGVMEVGWALRGYLVLVNADREAARFAARGIYLDFSQPDIENVGYQSVVTHTVRSIADQLPLDFTGDNPNATMIITHLEIDTGYPCSESGRPCDDECAANPNTTYADDDVVILPPPVGVGYASDPAVVISDTYRAQYGIGAPTYTTRIADTLWEGLRTENESLNCQLMIKNPEISPSANSVIIVELFYDQPQLLGVPLISNRFTNPIPLYASTMMRIAAARQR